MDAAAGAQIADLPRVGTQDGVGEAPNPGSRAFWTDISDPMSPGHHGDSVVDDPLKLIRYPASALSDAQRACCDELSRRIRVKVDGDPRASRASRRYIFLHDDPACVELIGGLVSSLQGLPQGSALELDHAPNSAEPAVLVSRYLPDRMLTGACPAHQDDQPLGRPDRPSPNAKRLVFFLLMQDIEREQGPTFVFPNSHYYFERKRGMGPCKSLYSLNSNNLVRNLTSKCGEPILLTGEQYTLFRMPASLWHGALSNHVERDRVVVGAAYCFPHAIGRVQVTRAGRVDRMGK
jgi:hypothetical protein